MKNETVSPQTDNVIEAGAETIPQGGNEITVPIKYNKETKLLDLETAAQLAQKGMKYEAVKDDYELLKKLALNENKSVPEFLSLLSAKHLEERKNELTEKCGGNGELAQHIMELENAHKNTDNGFSELSVMFPEFKTEDDLPHRVLERAKLRGTLLLDEYLRYMLENDRKLKANADNQKKAEKSSLGSQLNRSGAINPETEEFLKGLWK